MYALPFASMQNTPYLVYTGQLQGAQILRAMALQLFWLGALVCLGYALMRRALKKVVVQGG